MIIFSLIILYMLLGLGLIGFYEEFEPNSDNLGKNLCFFFWPVILLVCALKRIWG